MSLDCEIKEVINQDFLHEAQRAVGVWALEKDFKNVLGHKRLFLFFCFFPVLESEEKPTRDSVMSSLSLISDQL